MGMRTVAGSVEGGEIVTSEPTEGLSNDILDGEIVVLKDVFDPDGLRDLRDSVFQWGKEIPAIENTREQPNTTFHSIDVNPEESSHPKVYHSYNFVFNDPDTDSEIENKARTYFEQLRDFQNRLAGTDGSFGDLSGLAMRPIIIHYPRGGGGFPLHTHPFLPQKIGLIVSLSEDGKDFEHGGTRFAVPDGDIVDIGGDHTIGDIALFRIDLPHNVYPCDPQAELDFEDPAGRWSMILPYNQY